MAARARKPAAAAAVGAESAAAALPNLLPNLGYDEFADLGRDNLAAVMKANAAFSEGLEAISKEMLGFTRASLESAGHTATALLAAKTIEDVVQANADFAKQSLDLLFTRSARLSEVGLKAANEALAPLGSRVEAALSRFAKPLAA